MKALPIKWPCMVFVLFVASVNVNSQNMAPVFKGHLVYDSGNPERSNTYPEVAAFLEEFQVFKIDVHSLYNHVNHTEDVKSFTLALDQTTLDFDIWPHDVTTVNYRLRVTDGKEIADTKPSPVSTYKGYISNNPDNKVRLSIREDYLVGSFSYNGTVYNLQPARDFESTGNKVGDEHAYVFSKAADMLPVGAGVCDFGDAESTPAINRAVLQKGVADSFSQSAVSCTELAVVVDYAFYQKADSNITATENRVKDMLNLVQDLYDMIEIDYKMTELVIDASNSTGLTNNPNASVLQPTIHNWSQSGFKNSFDVATLYTAVDIIGDDSGTGQGLIGRAYYLGGVRHSGSGYIGGVCNELKFNIIEYFAGWGNDLTRHRVDWAHELSHNWNGRHVDGCGSCVMSPSLNGSENQWSNTTVNTINTYKSSINCLDAGACVDGGPPVTGFSSSQTDGCGSLTVQFSDQSLNNPTSWRWDFGDGTTSGQQNPSHTYATPGVYTVTLRATNNFGQNTETKTNLVNVGQGIPYDAENGGPANNNFGVGGYFSDHDERGIVFDVQARAVIESVNIYSDGGGQRLIQVLDAVGGNELASKTVQLQNGTNNVALGFALDPGTGYFIKFTGSVNEYRNSEGANYPYSINNLITLQASNAGSAPLDYYYYFYNWAVRKAGCSANTNVLENSTPGAIIVYPNPGNGIYRLQLPPSFIEKNVSLELFDIYGRTVREWRTQPSSELEKMDLRELGSGTYFLRVESESFSKEYKIIKLL